MTQVGNERDVHCPLCDYNLRGLVEPRCPECGHRFVWSELIDEGRRSPGWFFEHQIDRKTRAFLETFVASLFPCWFWRRVRPTNPPNVTRLMVWWMCLGLAILLVAIAPWAHYQWRCYEMGTSERRIRSGNTISWAGWMLETEYSNRTRIVFPVVLASLGWPWLTLAALLAFRRTMQRAQIKLGHVLRCVVYSMAPGVVLVAASTIVVTLNAESLDPLVNMLNRPGQAELLDWALEIACVLMLGTYLTVAYRRYLRFPHAIATCIAAQLIVAMALIALF
jgi:hypothetical protein